MSHRAAEEKGNMADVNKIRRNFNKKYQYSKNKARGNVLMPKKFSAKEFNLKYSDKPKSEINRQLNIYKQFGKRDALALAFPKTDSRMSKWEANYFKANRNKTVEFYDKEISDLERIIGGKVETHLRQNERLLNLQRKREKLDQDLSSLSDDEIKSLRSVYNYAERSDLTKARGFRLYLSQLERTMDNLGYSKPEIDAFLSKFNVLSDNEFTEMVRNEDLIDTVYDIIDSPKGRGKYQLMMEEKRAKKIVQRIMREADDLIEKYHTES